MQEILKLTKDGKYVENVLDITVTELSIPEGVVGFRFKDFEKCNHLQTLNLPSSFGGIMYLDECKTIRQINISPDNEKFSSKDGVIYNKDRTRLVFVPKSLKTTCFEIPQGVKTISHSSFRGCTSISKVVISDSVEEVNDWAFQFSSIQEVIISKGLVKISGNPFVGCEQLRNISVDIDNPCFSSVDGILLDKEHTRIIHFPYAKDVSRLVIPDGVQKIPYMCKKSNELVIPGSISEISDEFFKDCKKLQSVIISEGVQKIGASAFKQCI